MNYNCKVCGIDFIPKYWQIKRKEFYCVPCHRIKQKEYRDKAREKGKPYISGRMGLEYRRKYWKEYKTRESVKAFFRKVSERQRNNSAEVDKIKARAIVYNALRRGEITKQPCKVCGETKVDAHHPDYNEPFNIVWLCRLHHKHEHNKAAEQ